MKQSKFTAFDSFGAGGSRMAVSASVALHLTILLLFLATPMTRDIVQPQIVSVTFHSMKNFSAKNPAATPAPLFRHKKTAPIGKESSSAMKRKEIEKSRPEAVVEKKDVPIRENTPAAEQSALPINRQTAAHPEKEKANSFTGALEADVAKDDPAQGSPQAQTIEGQFGEQGAPSFIHREMPIYPALALRLGKEGRVLLKLLIDADGELKMVEVVEAAGYGFTEASLEAVRKSTYEPGFRNGIKVAMRVLLPVSFRLQ